MTDNEKLIEEAYRQGRSDEKYSLAYAPPVFEKAHTPTGDEREELALLIDPNALELHAYPFPLDAADRILAAGFRRTEVPEPSTEHQQRADARRAETMTLLSHSASQGEPSDAQVDAAWAVIGGHRVQRETVRAALRAAGGVR